jgi:type I restriction enzyme R subunit
MEFDDLMPYHPDAEEALENAVEKLFSSLDYITINAFEEINGAKLTGRETLDEVVLLPRLRDALERINPELPSQAIDGALTELTADRGLMSLAAANQQIYHHIKNGVKVTYKTDDGDEATDTVKVIAWNDLTANDWFAVRQLWVLSRDGLYKRRADVVLFVNGLPLVFLELKASHRNVENAFRHNLTDYKDTIGHIFWYNACIILSNGRYSRVGSLTAAWEHFHEWKRISDEKEAGRISLETILEGICDRARLLDLLENFILFEQKSGGLVKLFTRNHQYLGVNNAIRAVEAIEHNRGRLGVFWHTQGSGKSYSMVFFSQKVMRKLSGNWTFVVVTDRDELDSQIYKTFADVGAVPTQGELQADSGEDLKRLLRTDNRYVFTLIQKFHTRDGQPYPVLSERDDIIVMTDEAHRSQYDTFAANMRQALPNAAFIGFTGTPLIAGEEKTRQVFGEYVSVYDFRQSVVDGATVPLYYENRIPQVQLTNEQLNQDMEAILETAMLDDSQESRLEHEFRQEYQIITRDNRQQAIAQDIVDHYSERGFAGRTHHSKAMVVCIDKLTAVRMYNRVQELWKNKIAALEAELATISDTEQRQQLQDRIAFMRQTDMAVVISQEQNEVDFFRRHGIDIAPHRKRMVKEQLDEKFKKPADPFRVVFVCAMWMTGFDAQSCSTIYLDKPMRNHTLMQTIARANRVFKDKKNGLIVDYIGVFRNLEQALAIYGTGGSGETEPGDLPIQQKTEQIKSLREKVTEAVQFCTELHIDLDAISQARGFDREALKDRAIDAILTTEDTRDRFLLLVRDVARLYKAILPDPSASEFYGTYKLLTVLAEAILSEVSPGADISTVEGDVTELLDRSVRTERYVIGASPTDTSRRLDLSQIDFEELQRRFEQGQKHTATEKLKSSISRRISAMVRQNRTRMNYIETYQQMLDEYNAGSVNVDVLFEQLVKFVEELDEEEKRGIAENLSEEELAIFDLLTRPDPGLTDEERATVKKAARDLLETLRAEKLVLDWRRHQNTRAAVKECIREVLDRQLPQRYDEQLYERKVDDVYQHIYEHYFGAGQSIYAIR